MRRRTIRCNANTNRLKGSPVKTAPKTNAKGKESMSPKKPAAGASSAKLDENSVRAILEKRPGNVRANYQMMKLMMAQDRKEPALVHALRTVEKPSAKPRIYADVLKLLAGLKLQHLAALIGQDAMARGMADPRIAAAVARAQAAAKDVEAAQSTLESVEKEHPDNRVVQRARKRIERAKRPRRAKKAKEAAETEAS